MKRSHFFLSIVLSIGILISLLTYTGCDTGPVESFELQVFEQTEDSGGVFRPAGRLRLKENPDVEADFEGVLVRNEDGFASSEYSVVYPEEGDGLEGEGAIGFYIAYTSELPVVGEVRSGGGNPGEGKEKREDLPVVEYSLPATGGEPMAMVLPLGFGPLRFFQFRASGEEAPGFRLLSIGLQRNGMKKITDFYLPSPRDYDESVPVLRQYGYSLEYRFNPELLPATFGSDGETLPTVEFTLHGRDQKSPYRLLPREGDHTVHFYSKDLEFIPERFTLQALPPGFEVRRVSVRPYSLYARDTPEPIPVDPGVLLRYSTKAWRRSDWELFEWNLFSNILIFDFRDYAVQSAFLKRLSFFVEKKWSAGSLLPNTVIEPLHGWNAHDYRSADLARFFETAKEQRFPLNQEEYVLRDILLERGILIEKDGEYAPGGGGILSISQESSERLRYLFLTHEGYHGLYFASPEYRRMVEEYWHSLSGDEQQFWKLFLDWKWYNTEDTDLVINEFQAYLMQQHISHVDTYFKDYTIPRYLSLFPEYEEKAARFLEAYPDHFTRSAAKIEEIARSLVGISSGDLLCVREGPREGDASE